MRRIVSSIPVRRDRVRPPAMYLTVQEIISLRVCAAVVILLSARLTRLRELSPPLLSSIHNRQPLIQFRPSESALFGPLASHTAARPCAAGAPFRNTAPQFCTACLSSAAETTQAEMLVLARRDLELCSSMRP
jgi:hypothetical protein